MSFGRSLIWLAVVAVCAAGAVGWILTSSEQTQSRVSINYPEGVGAVVPLGISAGKSPDINVSTANPLAGDSTAIEEGKKLFRSMNCAGCHGYNATGGMGPDLTDKSWRYGGTPIDVYKSIYEGRPKGMPAWGSALPQRPIWNIVAYIQSLGGTLTPAVAVNAPNAPAQGQGAGTGQP